MKSQFLITVQLRLTSVLTWPYGCACGDVLIQVWAQGAMPGNASPNDIESNQSSWGVGANITTKLINQTGEVRTVKLITACN